MPVRAEEDLHPRPPVVVNRTRGVEPRHLRSRPEQRRRVRHPREVLRQQRTHHLGPELPGQRETGDERFRHAGDPKRRALDSRLSCETICLIMFVPDRMEAGMEPSRRQVLRGAGAGLGAAALGSVLMSAAGISVPRKLAFLSVDVRERRQKWWVCTSSCLGNPGNPYAFTRKAL